MSGFVVMRVSSSGMYTKLCNTVWHPLNHAKKILQHKVTDISNHLARSLFSDPSLSFIKVSRSSLFDVNLLSGPNLYGACVNLQMYLGIEWIPVHFLLTRGEIACQACIWS